MKEGPAGSVTAAFADVALPLLPEVARFALSLTRDPIEAEDLVQETYLRAFRGWRTFRAGTDCRRWLFTVCRNAFLRSLERREERVDSDEADDDGLPTAFDHEAVVRAGFGDLLDLIDVAPAIARAVDALPEPHRSILILVDVEGMSYEEAAVVLEIPTGTVRSRLFRARRRVQAALVDHARDMGLKGVAPGVSADSSREAK